MREKEKLGPVSRTVKGVIAGFLVASVTLLMLVVGPYVINFAGQSGYRLSSQAQQWAQFGDYLAGTLGTVFAMLAFFGVLLTVWLQATQLDLSGKQAALDEIQRVLANVASRVDAILAEPHISSESRPQRPTDLFQVLSSGGTAALRLPVDNWLVQAQLERVVGECKAILSPRCGVVGIELDQLAWLMGRYREEGGARSVVEFYVRRYNAIVCWLDVLGYLSAHPNVQREFSPGSIRSVLAMPPGNA